MMMILHINVSYCIGDPCSLNNEHQSHNLFMIFWESEKMFVVALLLWHEWMDGWWKKQSFSDDENTFNVKGTPYCMKRQFPPYARKRDFTAWANFRFVSLEKFKRLFRYTISTHVPFNFHQCKIATFFPRISKLYLFDLSVVNVSILHVQWTLFIYLCMRWTKYINTHTHKPIISFRHYNWLPENQVDMQWNPNISMRKIEGCQ